MKTYNIILTDGGAELRCGEQALVRLNRAEGAQDSFERLGDGAFLWKRHTDKPCAHMVMDAVCLFPVDYTMSPAVNYNGNGWGQGKEYSGYTCEGTPWTYGIARTSVPGCSYSEGKEHVFALMAQRGDTALSSSQFPDETGMHHRLIWSEEEMPLALCKRRFKAGEVFPGEEKQDFCAVIFASPFDRPRHSHHAMLDFAWRYYAHDLKPKFDSKTLWKLGVNYGKILYTEEPDGFRGFSIGLEWKASETQYIKRWFATKYELGWCGQNISYANSLLTEYLRSGDETCRDMALAVIDAWTRNCRLENGLMLVRTNTMPTPETHEKDEIDACNLGTGALHLFEAHDLLKKCGIDRPACLDAAFGICDFALSHQAENGRYAKSWDVHGSVIKEEGSVGCFLVPALLEAYRRTGKAEYLRSCEKAVAYYDGEFLRDGTTTAGALDSFCIDKESASPMLAATLALYDVTEDEEKKKQYLAAAEDLAYYICTWQWHYSVPYPKDSMLGKLGFDTLGSTGVSTAHNALDHYALRDVGAFCSLSRLTGKEIWLDRAKAIWANATQLISDGTLVVNGRTRVAGSQDEAICHCRWERTERDPYFAPTQWLVAWPAAFRMEQMRRMDTAFLDEGYVKR